MSGVPHMRPVPTGMMLAHGTHAPATHVCVAGHTVPQPPQLSWSVIGSMQVWLLPLPHGC
jgi:hypothetical protein